MSASRSVRICWASALVAALASSAGAQTPAPAKSPSGESPFVMKTPADWPESPELASGIAKQLARSVDFGGLAKNGGAAAFVKPQTGIIYVTWLLTTAPADKPEETVRLTLDQLRAAPGSSMEEVDYAETRVGQAIDVRMIWRHPANETLTLTRALVWRDAGSHIRLLRAECLFSESDKPAVAPICTEALKTLEATEITRGKVGELGAIAAPTRPEQPPDAGAVTDSKAGPSLDAVDPKRPLYENKPEDKGGVRDNLWLFIVGGVLILFAFWAATRGRREDDEAGDDEAEGDAAASEEEE